jgi:TolB protein
MASDISRDTDTDSDTTAIPPRMLRPGQTCVVHVLDTDTGEVTEVYRTTDALLEAPNWTTPGAMILNGNGVLWRLTLDDGRLEQVELPGLPNLNNDHVPGPDGDTMFVSGYDWHIHRVSLSTGAIARVTHDDPARPRYHFLHGVSPDGEQLAYVGIEPNETGPWGDANIYTIAATGGASRQLTFGSRPADGPEFSPDGQWIYFNTEAFDDIAGHAQIARMRPDGSELTQLTFDARVNWFPHLSSDGSRVVYLSFPPGTIGHPADLDIELRLVVDDDWSAARTVARLFGGQGTLNVHSWAPHTPSFGFVSYPLGDDPTPAEGER